METRASAPASPQCSSTDCPQCSSTDCPQCGAALPGGAARCPACGVACSHGELEALHPRWELAAPVSSGDGNLPGLWRRACRRIALAGETALETALRPRRVFDRFRFRGGLWLPTCFAMLVGGPAVLLGVAFDALLVESGRRLGPAEALVWLLLAPPLYVYLRGQCLHLTLVLTGSARETFVVTYRIVAYASGAVAPLLAVPVVGAFAFLLAGTLVEATGIQRAHGLTLLRAALLEAAPAAALLIGLAAAQAVRWVGWSQTGV